MNNHSLSERLSVFRDLCRQNGVPFTIQRRIIFQRLLALSGHPTADQLYDDVRAALPGVSRMTVYRVLDLLVDMGLIHRVSHPGSAVRFDPNLRHHHHLICLKCNRMVDFEAVSLEGLSVPPAAMETNFEVLGYSVQFRGLCPDCKHIPDTATDE